jgi:hypothetical protein
MRRTVLRSSMTLTARTPLWRTPAGMSMPYARAPSPEASATMGKAILTPKVAVYALAQAIGRIRVVDRSRVRSRFP